MILKIISKYGLAAHLGFLAASPVAFAPFLDAGALGRLVLWLSLFAVVWMIFDPSLRMGEHSADARKRVAMELVRDPFLWFFILVAAFALVRWLNSGIALRYDAEQSAWLVQEAAAPALPASAGEEGTAPRGKPSFRRSVCRQPHAAAYLRSGFRGISHSVRSVCSS